MRTLQAVRQVVYAALTSPQLVYTVNDGSPITLPVANVSSRAPWNPAVGGSLQPPSPFVAFSVGGRGHDTMLAERQMRLKIWVSSNSTTVSPDDEVTELYEAIRARLHGADDEATSDWLQFAPPSLSRTDTAQNLGLAVRRCREVGSGALPAEFETTSARWWISAEYVVIAV